MITLTSVLKANALSCLIFGVIFAVFPSQTGALLDHSEPAPTPLIIALGIVLIFNGFHLLWATLQKTQHPWLILYFCLGDALWVVLSIALLILQLWITSLSGILMTTVVAIAVGTMGFLQWRAIREQI